MPIESIMSKYYGESEKEQLRQWYKNYYSKNQVKENNVILLLNNTKIRCNHFSN